MNENLNLVEILKDCPNGTKLYSSVFGEVELYLVDVCSKYPIVIRLKDEGRKCKCLTTEGKLFLEFEGECILFPSRENRDWSKFKHTCEFKDGDILSYQCQCLKNRTIYIYRCHERVNTAYYVAISGDPDAELMIDNIGKWALNGYNDTARFATEEEKQKLFQAIKDKGYKWNAETKTLEKLVKPKFDPKTLKPFDRVIAKLDSDNIYYWFADFVSMPANGHDIVPCIMSNKEAEMIIPYNDDTKHLVGTSDEAPEYYRYWED